MFFLSRPNRSLGVQKRCHDFVCPVGALRRAGRAPPNGLPVWWAACRAWMPPIDCLALQKVCGGEHGREETSGGDHIGASLPAEEQSLPHPPLHDAVMAERMSESMVAALAAIGVCRRRRPTHPLAHGYSQLADFEVLLQTLKLPGSIVTIQTTVDLVALPSNSKQAGREGGRATCYTVRSSLAAAEELLWWTSHSRWRSNTQAGRSSLHRLAAATRRPRACRRGRGGRRRLPPPWARRQRLMQLWGREQRHARWQVTRQ